MNNDMQPMDVEHASAVPTSASTTINGATDPSVSYCTVGSDSNDTLTTIHAMRRQEDSGYIIPDYFSMPRTLPITGQPADVECRAAMATWTVQIVDHCNFKRETAAISMSFLDRFLSSPDGQQNVITDRSQFQLAAMACLYTAVKIHEKEAVTPDLIAQLSNGAHGKEDVEAMERRILNGLQWRVNPPTASAFVYLYARLLANVIRDPGFQTTAIDLAHFQVELAVCDYTMVTKRSSSVALCALLNAAESLLDNERYAYVEAILCQAAGVQQLIQEDPQMSFELQQLRIKLYEAIAEDESGHGSSSSYAMDPTPTPAEDYDENMKMAGDVVDDSPRSVSQHQ